MILFLALVAAAIGAVDLRKPIAELKLNDGRTLRAVEIISYAPTAVMAKWEGGRGTIAYDQFPKEYAEPLSKMRPAPSRATAPAVVSVEAAKKAADDKAAKRKAAADEQEKYNASVAESTAKANAKSARDEKVRDAIRGSRLIVGMTESEAMSSWGSPNSRNTSSSGTLDQWVYYKANGTYYVYFTGGLLSSWQESEPIGTRRR